MPPTGRREVRGWIDVVVALGTAGAVLSACNTAPPSTDLLPDSREGALAVVTHVSDGDSFVAEVDGTETRVRLIGVNAPERNECFGDESRQLLADLIDGQTVVLALDVEPVDQYGRTLAYVYLEGLLVNEEAARRGAVLTHAYPPNTSLQSTLDTAEAAAIDAQRGMWAASTCGGDPRPTVAITEVMADPPGRDEENLAEEYVVIENAGEMTVSLTGWIIKDESSVHRYRFPDGAQLEPGASLTLVTACGEDTGDRLHWCSDGPIWDNRGDTAFIVDEEGDVRHRFAY